MGAGGSGLLLGARRSHAATPRCQIPPGHGSGGGEGPSPAVPSPIPIPRGTVSPLLAAPRALARLVPAAGAGGQRVVVWGRSQV